MDFEPTVGCFTFKKVTKLENEIKRQKDTNYQMIYYEQTLGESWEEELLFNRKRAREPGLGTGNHIPLPGGGIDDELEQS